MMKRRIQILGVAGIAIFLAILGNSKSLVLWTQWIIIGDPKEAIPNKT